MHTQLPNVLGFVFGIIQMILYAIYRQRAKKVILEQKLPEQAIDISKLSALGVHPIATQSEEIIMIMEGLSPDAPTARAGDKCMASPNEILMTKFEEVWFHANCLLIIECSFGLKTLAWFIKCPFGLRSVVPILSLFSQRRSLLFLCFPSSFLLSLPLSAPIVTK